MLIPKVGLSFVLLITTYSVLSIILPKMANTVSVLQKLNGRLTPGIFVFSLASSGGHQPWHAPTQFYSRKDRIVRSLDDYFQPGISKADFQLIAPNTVKTEAYEGKRVSVKLDALPALPSGRRIKAFTLDCRGGHLMSVGDSSP